MTETTKSAIDLLYEAADIAAFPAADGWPKELTPKQLIALMVGHEWLPPLGEPRHNTAQLPDGTIMDLGYSPDYAAMEAGTDRAAKRTACRRIEKMLRDGGLIIEERSESISQPPKRMLVITGGTILKDQPPKIERWVVVTKAAVRNCLSTIGKAPSDYIRAWLGPEWKEAPGDADTRKSILRAIIAEMQRLDPTIPRGEKPTLPGALLGFHGLCIGKNRTLFARATSTFDGYRKGLCTFEQKGPPRPADLEYYRDMATQMGVKWEQPTKAKTRA